jgi:hypothetical protein
VSKVADKLPPELRELVLFEPGTVNLGMDRISTGLGTPHIESNPDFVGIMATLLTI